MGIMKRIRIMLSAVSIQVSIAFKMHTVFAPMVSNNGWHGEILK
jgi:hypothetical protein